MASNPTFSIYELNELAREGTATPIQLRRLIAEIVNLRMQMEVIEAMIDDGGSDSGELEVEVELNSTAKETIQ